MLLQAVSYPGPIYLFQNCERKVCATPLAYIAIDPFPCRAVPLIRHFLGRRSGLYNRPFHDLIPFLTLDVSYR